MAKWRGLGNAIVPPLAAEVIRAFMETRGDARARLHMPPPDGDDGIEATFRNGPLQLSLFA